MADDPLAEAERLIQRLEDQVTRQAAEVARMTRDDTSPLAEQARGQLASCEDSLQVAREQLHKVRRARDPAP